MTKRINYIDFLRGWAVILMVFWHLTEALISDSNRTTTFFDISQFVGGLVAPMFLFSSGASQAILLFKKRDKYTSFTPDLKKRIFRILQIFIIAYLLHLPEGNFLKVIMSREGDSYINFINVDVLQLIAFSLLSLQLLFFIIKKTKIYFYTIISICLMTIIFTPYIWQIDFINFLPVEISSWFNNKTGSLFPIFPWLAYVFGGTVVMQLLLEHDQYSNIKKFFIVGLIMILVGLIPEILNINITPYYNFWETSPNIFLIKFGIVLLFLFILFWLSEYKKYEMKLFGVFGYESLFIYVVHLLIIYGTSFYTLQHNFGRSLNWFELFVTYIIMIIILRYAGYYWGKLKRRVKEIRSKA